MGRERLPYERPARSAAVIQGLPIVGTPPGPDYVLTSNDQGQLIWNLFRPPIVVAQLGYAGTTYVWYPDEFIGLATLATNTGASVADFYAAATYVEQSAAMYKGFRIEFDLPCGTAGYCTLWKASPGGFPAPVLNPDLSEVQIPIPDNLDPDPLYGVNNTSEVLLNPGDRIAFKLNSAFGYTPGKVTITAGRSPR